MATPRQELERLRALAAQQPQQPIIGQQPLASGLSPRQELEQLRTRAQQAPEQPSFPGAGIIEPAATLISGAIAEPVAGLAGIAQAVNPFAEEGAGARAVEATREALTFQPRTRAGQESLQAVGGVLAPVGEALQAAETFLGDETFEATGSPALAAAAATLPTAVIEAIGLASTKGVVKGAARTKALAKNKAVTKAVVDAVPDIDQIKNASRAVYKELDDSGVRLLPKAYDGLNNRVQQAVKKAGFDPDLTPKTAAVLNRIASEKGQVHTLTDIDTLRKVAQNAASALEPADARLGAIMIDEIDTFLDVVKPEAFARGAVKAKDVTPKFKVARELWGRARRSELINEAFEKAKNQATGFENGLVTQFRTILNNKKKSRLFKPKELDVMKEVVRGTTAANIAKAIGRFGFSEGHATNILGGSIGVAGGAALGGPVGAVAVPLIGQTSRKLAQKLTRGKAEFANSIIRAGNDANDIAKAYMSKVPKAQRSASELSELLLRPDIAIDKLGISKNSFIREAAEIAQGQRALRAAANAATVATPGAIQTQRSE
jgi:hypothetical protein